jgi:hypothetical protein
MQELVQRVAAAAGIGTEEAGHAVGLMLRFLKRSGPQREVGELIAAIAGADRLTQAEHEDEPDPGIMGLAGELAGLGLDMAQMQAAGTALFAVARERVGAEVVGRIVAAIPGLDQVA